MYDDDEIWMIIWTGTWGQLFAKAAISLLSSVCTQWLWLKLFLILISDLIIIMIMMVMVMVMVALMEFTCNAGSYPVLNILSWRISAVEILLRIQIVQIVLSHWSSVWNWIGAFKRGCVVVFFLYFCEWDETNYLDEYLKANLHISILLLSCRCVFKELWFWDKWDCVSVFLYVDIYNGQVDSRELKKKSRATCRFVCTVYW